MSAWNVGLGMIILANILLLVVLIRGRSAYASGPWVTAMAGALGVLFSEYLPAVAVVIAVLAYLGGLFYLIALCTGKDMNDG